MSLPVKIRPSGVFLGIFPQSPHFLPVSELFQHGPHSQMMPVHHFDIEKMAFVYDSSSVAPQMQPIFSPFSATILPPLFTWVNYLSSPTKTPT